MSGGGPKTGEGAIACETKIQRIQVRLIIMYQLLKLASGRPVSLFFLIEKNLYGDHRISLSSEYHNLYVNFESLKCDLCLGSILEVSYGTVARMECAEMQECRNLGLQQI